MAAIFFSVTMCQWTLKGQCAWLTFLLSLFASNVDFYNQPHNLTVPFVSEPVTLCAMMSRGLREAVGYAVMYCVPLYFPKKTDVPDS